VIAADAVALARTLYRMGDPARVVSDGSRPATPAIRTTVADGRVVFSGGAKGEHGLWLDVSSAERVVAHFEGYCEANGLLAPRVGQRVTFPSASAWQVGGRRRGVVVSVGPKRALVAFTYKHGGKATKHVPIADLVFAPAPSDSSGTLSKQIDLTREAIVPKRVQSIMTHLRMTQTTCRACGTPMSVYRVKSHPMSLACAAYRAHDAGKSAGDRCAPGERPDRAVARIRTAWDKGYAEGKEVRYARIRAQRAERAAAATAGGAS